MLFCAMLSSAAQMVCLHCASPAGMPCAGGEGRGREVFQVLVVLTPRSCLRSVGAQPRRSGIAGEVRALALAQLLMKILRHILPCSFEARGDFKVAG